MNLNSFDLKIMDKTETKIFNKRAFISISMITAGLTLPISGLMNHLSQFEPLTSSRHFWMSVHNMSGVLFVIFVVIHIVYNWRAILRYAKKSKEILISKEALTAILLVIFILGLYTSHVLHVR